MARNEGHLRPYADLVRGFLEGSLSVDDFERAYMETFKKDDSSFDEDSYEALNDLFLVLEAYCADPELWSEGDSTKEQVVAEARRFIARVAPHA